MSTDLREASVGRYSDQPAAPEGQGNPEVERNLQATRAAIEGAALGAGREPSSVRLVAVSKSFPRDKVMAAYTAGAREFGENRIEEAREKIPSINPMTKAEPIQWHLIGHLQRRKAREALELFHLIQSVDSVKLAASLDRLARELGKRMPVLLQVNVARDPHKFGFVVQPADSFFAHVAQILELEALEVQGLMTIGPLVPEPEQARPFFRALRELRDNLAQRYPSSSWRELSMGMTDDFRVAIEEGATIVRIGRAIFGERT